MPVISVTRGCSSVGRAPALQAGGHEFESHHLHSSRANASGVYIENCIKNKIKNESFERKTSSDIRFYCKHDKNKPREPGRRNAIRHQAIGHFSRERVRSSYKERRVDAWALRADEGRDKLRKAAGRGKYPSIRGYPNVGTRQSIPLSSCSESIAA